MSIQVDSTTASDNDAAEMGSINPAPTGVSIMRMVPKTLTGDGNHTVTAKYKSVPGGGTANANFRNRWLIGLRYANA